MAAKKAISPKDMGGLKIINVGDGTGEADVANKGQVDDAYSAAISRANHTGTQLASTVSDLPATIQATRLDQMAAPTAPVGMNGQVLSGLADPGSAQDAATRAYVDAQMAGLATGQQLKGTVRVAPTTNINIASPGTTIDGVTMSNGDLVLLTGQSTGSQNGPYVFNGSAVAMTRATNWNTDSEAVLGSYWIVREGSTNADRFALMTNDTAITLGTTTPLFTFMPISQPSAGYTTTCPAVTGGQTWTVTHNLNSKAVLVQVYRTASPFDEVDVQVERDTVNSVLIKPDLGMASGEYTVVIGKVA